MIEAVFLLPVRKMPITPLLRKGAWTLSAQVHLPLLRQGQCLQNVSCRFRALLSVFHAILSTAAVARHQTDGAKAEHLLWHGMIFFHNGDDSEFVAKKAENQKKTKL